MARRISLATTLAALTLAAPIVGAQGVKQQGSSIAAVRAATNKTWDGLVVAAKAGDATTLSRAYTADALIIDTPMANISGRASIEKLTKDWFATTKFLDLTRTPLAFEVYGDIAIENGTVSSTTQEQGKPAIKNDGRYTIVWKRVDGKWLVHRDVTTPMPPKQ